jgi:tungstate transport system substrate-binding protein
MKRFILLCVLVAVLLVPLASPAEEKSITLATTTSTENSGLLDYLNAEFTSKTGIAVKVIARGSGAAIRMARDGNADVLLSHAVELEEKFVKQGYGLARHEVMYNDFIIAGPPEDPAHISALRDAAKAFARIADHGQTNFISRGDGSGTHVAEQKLWRKAGIGIEKPNSWYLSVGQGMGKTMAIAYEKRGYLLIDRGTYIALSDKYPLKILVEGDKKLFNQYAIIAVNPQKHPHVNHGGAKIYVDWWQSPGTQQRIAAFKVMGQQLFHPQN